MEPKYLKYLNIKHDYQNYNCITLIDFIYKTELRCNIFDDLWIYLNLPEGKPKDGRSWMRKFSLNHLETWAEKVATKVILTNLVEYDVIVFKSARLLPTHFGMYIGGNKFIHLEEDKYTKIEAFNQDWRDRVAGLWRINGINT